MRRETWCGWCSVGRRDERRNPYGKPPVTPVFLRHHPDASIEVPASVHEIVADFAATHACCARLWAREEERWRLLGAEEGAEAPEAPSAALVEVPGTDGTLQIEVEAEGELPCDAGAHASFLARVVARSVGHHGEVDFFSRELAERYEEITLLYSISEILGSVISLEEAAGIILEEVVDVLGARRAALWVHSADEGVLERIASVGQVRGPVRLNADDPVAVTAAVFRKSEPVILEADEAFMEREPPRGRSRESVLSVPLSYSPPEGNARTVGVINLFGRTSDGVYTAGDRKLLAAIASQVGAAVENSRLIAESLQQERVFRELELAHDLQLKLLPDLEPFADIADVAAACIPADSVGGDFYHLFRLTDDRVGVMIGDVSSHGFGAALIMALAMSAVGIHAVEGDPPGRVLERVQDAMDTELRSTEMYFTVFYGVIDPRAGEFTYANAGHAHAFRITGQGASERLEATDLPVGIKEAGPFSERTVPWTAGEDLLFLFTDGITDAMAAGEREASRRLLKLVSASRGQPLTRVMEEVLALPSQRTGVPADDRTVVLLRA